MENTIGYNLYSNIEELRLYHIVDGNGVALYRGYLNDTYKVWRASTEDEDFFIKDFPNENYLEYKLELKKENLPLLLMIAIEWL